MFDLDMYVFNTIVNSCRNLGATFYLGALEGFAMYGIAAIYAVSRTIKAKRIKK